MGARRKTGICVTKGYQLNRLQTSEHTVIVHVLEYIRISKVPFPTPGFPQCHTHRIRYRRRLGVCKTEGITIVYKICASRLDKAFQVIFLG